MQKIPLKLAKPGMKLGRPVTRTNGITVVAEGVELTQVLIDRLSSMDIERIVVQGNPLNLGEAGGGTAYDVRLKRLNHLFRGHGTNQWMMKVKAFLARYFELKAASKAAEDAALQAIEAEPDEENGASPGHGES